MINSQIMQKKQDKASTQKRERPDHLIFLLGLHSFSIEQVSDLLACDAAPSSLLRQCAWCGKITSGSLSGITLLRCTSQGVRPYLHPGFSHGICQSCICTYMPQRHHRHTYTGQSDKRQSEHARDRRRTENRSKVSQESTNDMCTSTELPQAMCCA